MTSSQLQRKQIRDNKTVEEISKVKLSRSNEVKPSWQVDYEKYGCCVIDYGLADTYFKSCYNKDGSFNNVKAYQAVKNMYWKISSYYIDREGKYTAENFPLNGYNEELTILLKRFREDLCVPIKHYE